MIINPEKIRDKYFCNKTVAKHLIKNCGISPLGIIGKHYYFALTSEVTNCLHDMPLWLKFLNIFDGDTVSEITK